jgi:hypothetical protein
MLTRGDDPPEPPVILTRGDDPPEPLVVPLSRRALDGPDEVGAARITQGVGQADPGNELAARVLNGANLPLAEDEGRAARPGRWGEPGAWAGERKDQKIGRRSAGSA